MEGSSRVRAALAVRSAAHFFVDAVCAAVLGDSGAGFGEVVMYDTLAFSTQCVTGLIADRHLRKADMIAAASCSLVAAAWAAPAGAVARAAAAGIGNSFFHTSAGAAVVSESEKKASPLGVFVAPGSIGLTLGTLFPSFGTLFMAGLVICAVLLAVLQGSADGRPRTETEPDADPHREDMAVLLLIFAAVAVRAFGGSSAVFSWKNGAAASIILTLAVFAGKTAGGFIADRTDVRLLTAVSVTLSSLLVAFGGDSPVLSLLGQFLINLTMPVTLWLMYLALPGSPGFAFGLAAAALWPGVLGGILVKFTGVWRPVCVIACFSAGTAAVIYSVGRLKRGGIIK